MCLGVPAEIVEVSPDLADIAVVQMRDALKRVNVGMLTAPVTTGTWVIVHMGFAMETISAEEAHDILEQLDMDL